MAVCKTVLLVDDDPDILSAMRTMVERKGYRVVTASDGNMGLAVAEREAPDLVVVDMMMPRKSGFLVLEKLKGRQVIWDIFNEPENVTTVPLRDLQRYVDRVLAAGRRADPQAKFTVVSRSRPEIIYWRGRGLDLYSHNIFNERSLEESVSAPKALDAPIMVAEMAPELGESLRMMLTTPPIASEP